MSESERFSVGEISHLSKISSMPLCKVCPGCGGMVNVRKVSCSCGHVFITKHSKPRLTAKSGSRKHTMSSFRALETDEQAAGRMSVDRACKAKKRVLETEEEAFERKSHDRASKGNKRALETKEEAYMCVSVKFYQALFVIFIPVKFYIIETFYLVLPTYTCSHC